MLFGSNLLTAFGLRIFCLTLFLTAGGQQVHAQHTQHTQHGEHGQQTQQTQQTQHTQHGEHGQQPAQPAQPAHVGHHAPTQHESGTAHAQTAPSDRDALFFERRQNDRMQFTQADVDFMVMMIPHHAQALIMSRLAPENNAGPALQRLAARILAAQSDEIALMQQWLRDRAQAIPLVHFDGVYMHINMEEPVVRSSDTAHAGHDGHRAGHDSHAMGTHDTTSTDHAAMGHGHHGHAASANESAPTPHVGHDTSHTNEHSAGNGHSMHDHSDMPGMLSQEQLYELAAARGAEFDRLFLSFMIGHHEGAVIMVNELFASERGGNDRESFRLASDIYTEQITEIDLMRLMLLDYTNPTH